MPLSSSARRLREHKPHNSTTSAPVRHSPKNQCPTFLQTQRSRPPRAFLSYRRREEEEEGGNVRRTPPLDRGFSELKGQKFAVVREFLLRLSSLVTPLSKAKRHAGGGTDQSSIAGGRAEVKAWPPLPPLTQRQSKPVLRADGGLMGASKEVCRALLGAARCSVTGGRDGCVRGAAGVAPQLYLILRLDKDALPQHFIYANTK